MSISRENRRPFDGILSVSSAQVAAPISFTRQHQRANTALHGEDSAVVAKHPRQKAKKAFDPQKVAAKKARREQRKAVEAAERARAVRRRRIRQAVVGAGFVIVVGFVGAFLFGSVFPGEIEGVERPSSRGRTHVAAGQDVDYDDAAPTSGSHYA